MFFIALVIVSACKNPWETAIHETSEKSPFLVQIVAQFSETNEKKIEIFIFGVINDFVLQFSSVFIRPNFFGAF